MDPGTLSYAFITKWMVATDDVFWWSGSSSLGSTTSLWLDTADGIPNSSTRVPFLATTMNLPVDDLWESGTMRPSVGLSFADRVEESSPFPPYVENDAVALDPNVIVLPVNVYVFRNMDGEIGSPPEFFGEEYFRQRIDASRVYGHLASLWQDEGTGEWQSEAQVARWWGDSYEMLPDTIWSQCDIQFRTRKIEEIRQDQQLDVWMYTEDGCEIGGDDTICEFAGAPRITPFIKDVLNADPIGLNIFVGGEIHQFCHSLAAQLIAVSCGVAASPCNLHPNRNEHFVVMGAEDGWRTRKDALAHELGHQLGLGHRTDSCVGGFNLPNLMSSGGVSSIESAYLTPLQCNRARCIARQWLAEWGLAETAPDYCDPNGETEG